MADEEDQQSTEPVEVQGLTREQKAQALGVTLQGLDALERQVSSGTLPTQPAPRPAPPAPPMQPGGAPGYEFGRGIGVLQPPAQSPAPTPQGRMYMGPSMSPDQEQQFMQSPAGTRTNLMPPPSGPPPSRLEQAQAADPPGSRTIGIHDEPPYSDASMANQQNAMRYEAMKKFQAGDRSPEVMAAAMGTMRGQLRPQAAPKTPPRWVPTDRNTGAPGHFETTEGAVRFAPAARAAAVPKPPPMNTVRTVMPPDVPGGPSRTITEHVPAGSTTGTAGAPSANEEKRKTKDGRVAVYDAKTKRFIRYENAQ